MPSTSSDKIYHVAYQTTNYLMTSQETYVVYWLHTSAISPAGNKAKSKTLATYQKAMELVYTLQKRIDDSATYQSGYVSRIAMSSPYRPIL
jgi:hypothetical protein